MARAIAARFCMPPLSSDGMWFSKPSSPTSFSFMRAIKVIAASGRSVNSSSGNLTFSIKDSDPKSAPL